MINVVISGVTGKMGKSLVKLISSKEEWNIVGGLASEKNRQISGKAITNLLSLSIKGRKTAPAIIGVKFGGCGIKRLTRSKQTKKPTLFRVFRVRVFIDKNLV